MPNFRLLPKHIILVRHGESEGNKDPSVYTTTPDYKISLTEHGRAQARLAGSRLRDLISTKGPSQDWRVYFYVSPYERTRSTLREIGKSFSKKRVIGVREECRIREQDFGNFQVAERMRITKETREKFGRFFYRFPEGFLESLWRDIDLNRFNNNPSQELNLIIISHGLASRVFLMKWFKWSVEQFEGLYNPGNCEIRVMELGPGGEYSLAIHHTDEELQEWGLSPEMIEEQKWRIKANKADLNYHSKWYLNSFFDQEIDSDADVSEDVVSDNEFEDVKEENSDDDSKDNFLDTYS
ncbi:phosphoglycerate mutase-like protein AT74 isoform X2 [Hibiscus syriacus]|uniref:phosphoglycerate mutase-like protein AT74 isoform X2 n=1 Tax=Hibiscus syriacus TaxID=106335 RepID=UPI001924053F|nr:phosphoglycerate mutase-like protein AT74 isoform X2 [Hibiscus syriacus]